MDRIEEHERMAGVERSPPADPSKIGETASNGCVRLTNRDAEELAAGVKPGVAVRFIRGPDAEPAPDRSGAVPVGWPMLAPDLIRGSRLEAALR